MLGQASFHPPEREETMPRVSSFTREQKLEIALGPILRKLSHSEVCRKHGISSTCAYRLKDRALELLGQEIDHGAELPNSREKKLAWRNGSAPCGWVWTVENGDLGGLVLRSNNGAQPCSKRSLE